MAFEKSWGTVLPIPLTADGTTLGVIKVADTIGFQVKGLAQLANNLGLSMIVQVNQVLNSTTIIVGKPGSSPSAMEGGLASGSIVDVSAFTVATASTIGFGMQPKSKIKPDDIEQATYQNDPTVAVRVVPVDPYGDLISPTNPLPVEFEGTISIGTVGIIGPPPTDYRLIVNSDGSINVVTEGNSANTPTVYNLTATLANTEYSQLLPDNTKKFELKVRNSTARLQFAFTSGGSSANYISLSRGAGYEVSGILATGLTIYFQVNSPNQIIELLVWV